MKQRRVKFALFAIAFVVCLIAAVPTFASQARIVRLSQLSGDVQIDRGGIGLEKAVLNMPVIEGTRLMAGNDATAEIEFENGSTLRIVGPATVNFRELSLRSEGDKTTLIDLQPGIYYFDVKHKGDDDFRVGVASDNLRARKSARFRVEATTSDAKVGVYKGELMLEGADREVTIKSNETVTLDSNDPGRYFLAKGIDSLFSDSWDKERSEYRDRYADADTWKYANNHYGSPYSYGFSDLNYYGNYFNAPGWGWMWRPSMYDASWDPFSNGAWAFYPGQGWMFVSMYPWGWAPYRYGQWVFVPQYGWCWRPGNRYNYWNPVPVIRNAPGTWHRPMPPTTNMTRTVFVNPAPASGPQPAPTWRRPRPGGPVPPMTNQGHIAAPAENLPNRIDSRGSSFGGSRKPGVDGEVLRQDGSNLPKREAGEAGNIPRRSVSEPSDRGSGWHRVVPEQPRPVQPGATQTAPAAPQIQSAPQRTISPPPARHMEPRSEPRSTPHIDRAPESRGTWSRPSSAPPPPPAGTNRRVK